MKEVYNQKKKRTDNTKAFCNTLFGRLAEKYKGNVLILDGADARTAHSLELRHIRDKNIFIPNPYSYKDLLKTKFKNVFNMTVGKFISKVSTHPLKFNSAWLDYCCSFDGNSDMKPQEDIKNYFKNKLHKEGAFAVTFCYRKGTKVHFTNEDFIRVERCIQTEAFNNGYVAIKQNHRSYTGMFFILYEIHIIKKGMDLYDKNC